MLRAGVSVDAVPSGLLRPSVVYWAVLEVAGGGGGDRGGGAAGDTLRGSMVGWMWAAEDGMGWDGMEW